jgi:amino acid transporter
MNAREGAVTPGGRGAMTVWSVAALGIGSMVGAGIFALLGQAALLVGDWTWLSFALGGAVAVLSGYSYARLGARYPSAGGIVRFFEEAFGRGTLSATLSLLYLVTLPITVAMVARTFGAYATRLVLPSGGHVWFGVLGSAIVVVLVMVNAVGAGAVGRAELALVAVKLVILAGLLAVGAWSLGTGSHAAAEHARPAAGVLLSSVGLTFFAYSGYGMTANAADAVADPAKAIPRAIFLAIAVVAVLYVGLAITVLGLVPPAQLVRDADTAVAQAARPVLGSAGFTVVTLGALLATSSAINATLFSALNISHALAGAQQLPRAFQPASGRRISRGFLWGVAGVLVAVNFLSLNAIANVASATFLLCYLAVFVAAWRLAAETGASRPVLAVGFVAMLVVLVSFLVGLIRRHPLSLGLIGIAVGGCVAVEATLRARRRRASRG